MAEFRTPKSFSGNSTIAHRKWLRKAENSRVFRTGIENKEVPIVTVHFPFSSLLIMIIICILMISIQRDDQQLDITMLIFRFLSYTLMASSISAEASQDIEQIVVIGSQEEVRRVPGSGNVLHQGILDTFDYVDLTQVLAAVPGVYIREEDGYGLRPNIGIRGATTERSQKITIMEDGVLITPAPYSAPAAYYVPNVSRMEAIEVLKGPSAIKNGPHTVGGSINFVTRRVPMNETTEVDLSYGNDGFYKLQGIYGNTYDSTGFLVDATSYGSDGFKELDGGDDTGFVRNEINIKVQHDFSTEREQRLIFKLGYADEDANETYLGLTDADFAENPERRYAASQLARFESEHISLHINYGLRWSEDLRVNVKLYRNEFDRQWEKLDGFISGPSLLEVLSRSSFYPNEYGILTGAANSLGSNNDTLDVTANDRSYTSSGLQASAMYDLQTGSLEHKIETGLRVHADDVERDHRQQGFLMLDSSLVNDGFDRGSKLRNEANTKAISLYIEDAITWRDLQVTAGLRFEDIEGKSTNLRTGVHQKNTQSFAAPGLGVHWQATERIGLLAGVYQGFSPAGPGAENVNPEESINYEYGIRYENNLGTFDAVGFFSDYAELLGRCRVNDVSCKPGDEFNAGAVEVKGAEITSSVKHQINDSIAAQAQINYTYTTSEFLDTFFSGFSQWGFVSSGDELPYLPEHTGQLRLGLNAERWELWGSYRWQSQMREEPGSGPATLGLHTDSLAIIDLTAMYRVSDQWRVHLMLQNLANESSVVSHRPFGARPNRPRSTVLRIKYTN